MLSKSSLQLNKGNSEPLLATDGVDLVNEKVFNSDPEKAVYDDKKGEPSSNFKSEQDTVLKAVLFMLTGSISMNLMSTLIKLVDIYSGGNVSAWQTGLCRSCGMAGFSLILCKYWKIGLWNMPKNQRLNVFMRIFFGCVAQMTQFVSIYMLPFSLAIVLQFT